MRSRMFPLALALSLGVAACSALLDWNFSGGSGAGEAGAGDVGVGDMSAGDAGASDSSLTDHGGQADAPLADAPFEAGADSPAEAASDGGPIDAGNPSLCDDAGLLFCDGFENDSDGGSWTPSLSGGSANIDPSMAYRGSHSLHAQIDQTMNGMTEKGFWANHSVSWPSTIYMRAFVYFPAALGPNAETFLLISGNNGGVQLELFPPNSDLSWTAYGGSTLNYSSTYPPPLKKWVCLELYTDGQSSVKVFAQDQPVSGLTQSLGGSLLPWVDLSVGLGAYMPSPQPAAEVWIDEIAADTSFIPCAK